MREMEYGRHRRRRYDDYDDPMEYDPDPDLMMDDDYDDYDDRHGHSRWRSNHRMDEPSRAILVPANRFEVLECRAAL